MTKRLPYPRIDDATGERYWRSLREHDESPAFQDELAREFPDGIAEPPDGVSRREFFRAMGASFALAGVAACRRPNEKILPYTRQPEHLIPGRPLLFATTMPWNGTGLGLLVESHEGRPTKIEGNPKHPESLGAANSFAQAEVLNLYDPDRSSSPTFKGAEKDWDEASAALRELGARAGQARGKGLAILTEGHRSPTTKRLLDELKTAMPQVTVHRYDALSRDNARLGAQLAFGTPFDKVIYLTRSKIIVAFDSDFLIHDDGGALRHCYGFSAGRRQLNPGMMNRLYSFESSFSVTGAMANHRLRMTSKQVAACVAALANELGVATGVQPDLPSGAMDIIRAVAKELRAHTQQSIVVVGEKQPPIVHALVAHINIALSNTDATLAYVKPFDEGFDGATSLMPLAKAIADKQVTSLVILGGNPAFNAPADARFADALGGLESSFHLGLDKDETSARCQWHLNRAHFLEAWEDVRSTEGVTSFVQPLIAPLFNGKTDAEVLSMLAGKPASAYDLVRQTHGITGPDKESGWKRHLHDGVVTDSVEPAASPQLQRYDLATLKDAVTPFADFEVTFVPDDHAWDGRYANNGWLQEQPDNMAKLTWGNAAHISPTTAKELGVGDGDHLELTGEGGVLITVPALVMPGHADRSLTLTIGQGRTECGRVGKGVGVDTTPLRTSTRMGITSVKVRPTGDTEKLARTQEHYAIEEPFTGKNRRIVREGTINQLIEDPDFVKKMEEPHPPLLSLFPDVDYSKVQKWALAIDLNTCIGCSACVTACTAENNIPVVGKSGVLRSREMHWIRIDRYFKGKSDGQPESVTQPMTCQQCENAPCETVCPVAATTHSEEGLNDMVYNRCIGTKYCLNNCPFKVRRFNYFHYTKDLPLIRRAQFNPDVTVRSRGIMEKCTYCVQRINVAKIDAHRVGKDKVADGIIKTACAQTCPTQAIMFGDLNDPQSAVSVLKAQPRSYVLLQEINVRPRTTYLAKIRNKNGEIA